MGLRVDLERLKAAAKEVRELHQEARKYRRRFGEMLARIQQLQNTIEGLAQHYGFVVDLTPTGRDSDATSLGRKTSPICSDSDVDQLVDEGLGQDDPKEVGHDDPTRKVKLIAELPPGKDRWPPGSD